MNAIIKCLLALLMFCGSALGAIGEFGSSSLAEIRGERGGSAHWVGPRARRQPAC